MKKLFGSIFFLLLGWVVLGDIVFSFRHPWATETERFLYIVDAMAFRKVPYETMRPRE